MLARTLIVAVAALIGGALACVYDPKVPDGAIRCDESQRCPAGTLCTAVREGASVLLVCCRNPACEGRAAGTGAAIVTPQSSSDPPAIQTGSGGTDPPAVQPSADDPSESAPDAGASGPLPR